MIATALPFTRDRLLYFFGARLSDIAWRERGLHLYSRVSMKAFRSGILFFSLNLGPCATPEVAPKMTCIAMTNSIGEILHPIATHEVEPPFRECRSREPQRKARELPLKEGSDLMRYVKPLHRQTQLVWHRSIRGRHM